MNVGPNTEGTEPSKSVVDATTESISQSESQVVAQSESQAVSQKLYASVPHQGYTLIGVSFVIFEFIFLILYTNDFWFNLNVLGIGIPAVVAAIAIAHVFMTFVESEVGCNFFAPLWKRRPPIVYRHWLRLNEDGLEPGFSFGQRHLRWNAIDELELTFWGNLRIFSSALSGKPSVKSTKSKIPFFKAEGLEEVLKIPFTVASPADQKLLIETMRSYNPDLKINQRLLKRIDQKEVKGTTYVQFAGVLFLLIVLFDVGFSMFSYLEMLKNYYYTEVTGTALYRDERKVAPIYFEQAEAIRTHPLPFSWVSNKIMSGGKIASGIYQTRAEALWAMGRKGDAIASMQKSLDLSPTNFRLNLKLARMMALNGQNEEAIAQLKKGMDNHESALLPRLYSLSLTNSEEQPRLYKTYLHDLDDELFGTDLMWPPGSHVFLQDVFYRDDLTFIFDRMLHTDSSGIRGKALRPKEKKDK